MFSNTAVDNNITENESDLRWGHLCAFSTGKNNPNQLMKFCVV